MIPASAAVGAVVAFVLVMAPWWIRQLAVFGTLSPSMASGKVLFIRSIGEWDSIATPATLEHLLGMGAGPLIASRVGGFLAAVTIYVVLIAGLVLAPFIVVGGWARRRSVDFGPFFTYAAVLFGFSALLSAVHVPGGTFIHSPWRWRRTATCSRSEAWRSSWPGSAGVGPPGIPAPRRGWQRWVSWPSSCWAR